MADAKLVIAPIAQRTLTLKQLLAQVTDENLHHEVETGDDPDEHASDQMERKKPETVEQAKARLVRELKDYYKDGAVVAARCPGTGHHVRHDKVRRYQG